MRLQIAAIVILTILFSLSPSSSSMAQEPAQPKPQAAPQVTQPVPVQSVVFIGPTNSRISFVGIHVGDEPKPRLGGFKEFQGYAVVDPNNTAPKSIVFEINVDSIWTQFQKLTGHLKNADFFDTAKFPTAQFLSTEVKVTAKGQCQITGNLTLHGVTKQISFPAQYNLENGGLVLATKFKLDRSQFGMDQMLSDVDKLVEIEIFVGQKTTPGKEQDGHGGDSKKEGSSIQPPTELQHVSIKLPNMT